MKKLFSLLLTATMFLCVCSFAFAADFDLDSMTDEELSELYARIQDKLFERGLLIGTLYEGYYLAGEDIPAGRYVLSAVEVYDSKNFGPYTECIIYEYDPEIEDWDYDDVMEVNEVGKKISFTIEEGQKLRVAHGVMEVSEFRAK